MTFTEDEAELLLDVIERAIYESQDEVDGIQSYLNYLQSDFVLKRNKNTLEMQSDAIDCARGHYETANSDLNRLVELKIKIIKESESYGK